MFSLKKVVGGGGYRSPYLMHAKHSLYHVSYTPRLSFEQKRPLIKKHI